MHDTSEYITMEKVDESAYTVAQFEHFGDAIVAVCARIICHEIFGKHTRGYFYYSTQLVSNFNLRSAEGVRSADQLELILGLLFVKEGANKAINRGIDLLKSTGAYREARLCSLTVDLQHTPHDQH